MTPRFPRRRGAERGSALLVAIVIILMLGLVGMAVVSGASRETEAVGAKKNHDATVACADAARQLLMSQFSAYGITPTELTLKTQVNGATMSSGHRGDVAAVNVKAVQAVPVAASSNGSDNSPDGETFSRDVANVFLADSTNPGGTGTGMGGRLYRMTVTCSNPSPSGGAPRVAEVEYLVRFGL